MPHHTSGGDPRAELAELAPDRARGPPRAPRPRHRRPRRHDGARWLPARSPPCARSSARPTPLVAVDTRQHRRHRPAARDRGPRGRRRRGRPASRATPASARPSPPGSRRAAPRPARAPDADASAGSGCCTTTAPPSRTALAAAARTPRRRPRRSAVVGPKVRGWHDQRQLLEVRRHRSRAAAAATPVSSGTSSDQGQHDGAARRARRRHRRDARTPRRVGRARRVRPAAAAVPRRRRPRLARQAGPGTRGGRHRRRRRAPRRGGRPRAPPGPAPSAAQPVHRAARPRARRCTCCSPTPRCLALPFVLAAAAASARCCARSGCLLGKARARPATRSARSLDVAAPARSLWRSRARVRAAGRLPGASRTGGPHPAGPTRRAGPGAVGAGDRPAARVGGPRREPAELQAGEDVDAVGDAAGAVAGTRWLAGPAVLLVLGLLVATLVALRGRCSATGSWSAARCCRPRRAPSDLWHQLRRGVARRRPRARPPTPPPWLALLALPAAVLRGQAPLAVDVVVLLAVPLAGAVRVPVAAR